MFSFVPNLLILNVEYLCFTTISERHPLLEPGQSGKWSHFHLWVGSGKVGLCDTETSRVLNSFHVSILGLPLAHNLPIAGP